MPRPISAILRSIKRAEKAVKRAEDLLKVLRQELLEATSEVYLVFYNNMSKRCGIVRVDSIVLKSSTSLALQYRLNPETQTVDIVSGNETCAVTFNGYTKKIHEDHTKIRAFSSEAHAIRCLAMWKRTNGRQDMHWPPPAKGEESYKLTLND